MEMKRTNEAERWFRQTFYDLQAARWNLEGGFFSTVCFLAQQSGEKALKALLYAKRLNPLPILVRIET
jgi:HEPN domain-containing protein